MEISLKTLQVSCGKGEAWEYFFSQDTHERARTFLHCTDERRCKVNFSTTMSDLPTMSSLERGVLESTPLPYGKLFLELQHPRSKRNCEKGVNLLFSCFFFFVFSLFFHLDFLSFLCFFLLLFFLSCFLSFFRSFVLPFFLSFSFSF